MSQIVVNGVGFQGNNITIRSGNVIIDGNDVTPESKTINISVVGDITTLSVSSCDKITVKGNVDSISTQNGDVEIAGNVTGDVKTMSGDVDCGDIGGSIKTMSGDIKHRSK